MKYLIYIYIKDQKKNLIEKCEVLYKIMIKLCISDIEIFLTIIFEKN